MYQKKLLSLLYSQNRRLDYLYAQLSCDMSQVLKSYKSKSVSKGVWFRNAQVEKKLDGLLVDFHASIAGHTAKQVADSWTMAEKSNSELTRSYLEGVGAGELGAKYLQENTAALQAFLTRKKNGLNLSERVWNLTHQTKEQLEYLLQSGITEGRPAAKLATDLKKYLKESDRRYRRLRNKDGKLILSEPAKNYNPGRGVYRSSYKNALRLARNEINIAYRAADFERRKQLDFVVGITVSLSSVHPTYDICDELVGDYPKDFQFLGWHPNCLCFATSKLLKKTEFVKYLNGGEINPNSGINSIPVRAEKFINENADKIKGYKTQPYFIADNFKPTKTGFVLKKGGGLELPKKELSGVGFIPAKTKREAKEFAVEQFLKYSGLDIHKVVVSSKMSLENLNKYNKQLSSLLQEYKLASIYNKKNAVALEFRSAKRYYGCVTTFDRGRSLHSINFGHLVSKNRLGKRDHHLLKSLVDKESLEVSTLTHEFAHVMTNSSQAVYSKKLQDFWSKIKEVEVEYKNELREKLKGKKEGVLSSYLGRYSLTNINEFMAEAFTEYKLNSKPSKYAMKVGKIIDENFKR